jgi:hypothetical protein
MLEIAYELSGLKRGTTIIKTATDRASKVVFALKPMPVTTNRGKRQ